METGYLSDQNNIIWKLATSLIKYREECCPDISLKAFLCLKKEYISLPENSNGLIESL